MIIDDLAKELDVMQLSDSFFPTGLFTTSNGLENLFLNKKVVTYFFLFFLMFLHQNNLRKQALVSYQVKISIAGLF